MPGLEVAVGVGRVGLLEDGPAGGQPDGGRVVEAPRAGEGAEVVVEAAVLLHLEDQVLDLGQVERPGAHGGRPRQVLWQDPGQPGGAGHGGRARHEGAALHPRSERLRALLVSHECLFVSWRARQAAGAVGPAAVPGWARPVTWAILLLWVSAMYRVVGARVDGDPVGGVQLRRGGGLAAAFAAGGGGAAAGGGGVHDGGDGPGWGDLADGVVEGVGDEQVAGAVEGDALRVVELRAGGGAAVSGEPAEAAAGLAGGVVAGHGGDDAGPGVDPADDVAGGVGDVQVAVCVQRDAGGLVQPGEGGRAAVAGVAGGAVAGDGDGLALGGDLHDPVVVGVGDVQVAVRVDGDVLGVVQ